MQHCAEQKVAAPPAVLVISACSQSLRTGGQRAAAGHDSVGAEHRAIPGPWGAMAWMSLSKYVGGSVVAAGLVTYHAFSTREQ